MSIRDIFELAQRAQETKPGSPPDHSIESIAVFFGLGLAAAVGIVAAILLWGDPSRSNTRRARKKGGAHE